MIVSSPRASQPHIIPIHMHILPGAKAFRQTTPSNILCAHSKLMQYRNACDRTNTCDAPNQRPLHRSHPCKSCFVFAPSGPSLQSNSNLPTATFSPAYAARISQPIQREFRRAPHPTHTLYIRGHSPAPSLLISSHCSIFLLLVAFSVSLSVPS